MNELLYEVGKVTFLLGILNNLRYFLVAGISDFLYILFEKVPNFKNTTKRGKEK